ARELGLTVLFVTHDQEEAMVMSDRIAVLSNGYLQQFDDPMTVYRNPVNRFVAEFIGSPKMNIMPAPSGDATLLVGTRPQGMNPVHKQANADDFAVTGTLRIIEPA